MAQLDERNPLVAIGRRVARDDRPCDSASILVPQIANSLRYALQSQGVDVSKLLSDGTQPVKVLDALFGMTRRKEIFGASRPSNQGSHAMAPLFRITSHGRTSRRLKNEEKFIIDSRDVHPSR